MDKNVNGPGARSPGGRPIGSGKLVDDLASLLDLKKDGALEEDSFLFNRTKVLSQYEDWVSARSLAVTDYKAEWAALKAAMERDLISKFFLLLCLARCA